METRVLAALAENEARVQKPRTTLEDIAGTLSPLGIPVEEMPARAKLAANLSDAKTLRQRLVTRREP